MFLKAHTTAKTQKRQVRVLRSKYPRYSESGGTIKDVTAAANKAMHKTALLLINRLSFVINHVTESNYIFKP